MITTIISTVGTILLIVLGYKWFTGRNKRQDSKDSLEKISTTLGDKIERELGKAAAGVRTTKVSREEFIHGLEKMKKNAKEKYTQYVTSIVTSKCQWENIKKRSKDSIPECKAKAQEAKSKWKTDNNTQYKTIAEGYLSNMLQYESRIVECDKNINDADMKIDTAKFEYDRIVMTMETMSMQAVDSTLSPNANFAIEYCKVNDLYNELQSNITKDDIKIQVSGIVDGASPVVTSPVDTETLNKAWDAL